MYHRKKAQLRKIKRVVNVEEKMLFHGTGHSNIQAICTYNFDWRLTGSHGDVYGKGIVYESYCIKGLVKQKNEMVPYVGPNLYDFCLSSNTKSDVLKNVHAAFLHTLIE